MGPLEVVLILVLALIVFGPEKLPELFAQLGRFTREIGRMTSEMTAEFNRAMQVDLEEASSAGQAASPASPPAATSPAANGSTDAAPPSETVEWHWEGAERPAESQESTAPAGPDDPAAPRA